MIGLCRGELDLLSVEGWSTAAVLHLPRLGDTKEWSPEVGKVVYSHKNNPLSEAVEQSRQTQIKTEKKHDPLATRNT